MGESACLVRSFSHPSDSSRQAKEGDPIRALGESISFGRFMSESLAWEKWSAFSHNRYLEEVEKFSKPGSVAQKKAYFEAHYKKKAAERAAALLEEANAEAHNITKSGTKDNHKDDSSMVSQFAKAESHEAMAIDEQQENDALNSAIGSSAKEEANAAAHNVTESETKDNHKDDSSMASQFAIAGSHEAIDEQQENDALNSAIGYCTNENGCNPNVQNEEIAKVEEAEAVIEERVNVEDSTLVEISQQFENVEEFNKIMATQEEKKPKKEAAVKEIPVSPSKKRQVKSSLKLSTQSRPLKLPASPVKRMTSMQPTNGNNDAVDSKKSAGEMLEKKRLTTKALHMSINFASCTGETSKTTFPAFQKVGSSRTDATLSNLSRSRLTSLQTSTRASVNRLSKAPSVKPQPEDRRTTTLLNKSVSGGITGDWKGKLSMDRSKPSSGSVSKASSPTISSPFTFRSEERAAKRKEFFQKCEEKINVKEAEKVQLQPKSKEKAQNDIKRLRQSTDFKAKLSEDINRGSQSPSNHQKKIPPTWPRSPKPARKPTPSRVQDSSSRPPRWPSVRNDSSKRHTEKVNQTTSRSVTLLPMKNAHENASPNIQHLM